MSLIKQSDVKNHLSHRHRTTIHLIDPVSQCDTTSTYIAPPDAIQTNPLHFAEDFVAEHSSSSTVLAPGDPVTGSVDVQASDESKSVQP